MWKCQNVTYTFIHLCWRIDLSMLNHSRKCTILCVQRRLKMSQNTWNCFSVPLLQNGTIPISLIFDTTEVVTKKFIFAACALPRWHGWLVNNRKVSDTLKTSSAIAQMKSFLLNCLPEKYYDQGKLEVCMSQTIFILLPNRKYCGTRVHVLV